jgi:5'-3' exoribonuclease 1
MLLREKMSVVMAGRGRNKYRKKKDMMEYTRNDFELLELSSLRALLTIQFRKFADQLEDYSLERVIDDFVFYCMLVGNDFLTHCPHLEINGGALSLMTTTYIDLLPKWGGYLTDREKINPKRFEEFMYHLAVYEEEHFKRRGNEENEPGWKLSADTELDKYDFYGQFYEGSPTPPCAVEANFKGSVPPPSRVVMKRENDEVSNHDVAEDLLPVEGPTGNRAFRRRHPDSLARSYRDFYYESKLGWKTEDRERTLFQRRAHVRDYMEGLHWNLNYYHNGCASWDWYFPHLYSPLATDMVNLDEFYHDDPEDAEFKSFKFDLGEPFPSLAQLLSVLPPQSSSLLPPALGELMLHPSSPLISYYPPDFESDPNGKRQSWEAVVKVPFIDGDLLLETVERVLEKDGEDGDLLTPSERRRNQRGQQYIYSAPGFDGELPNGESPPKKQATKKPSSKVKGATKQKDTTASAGSAKKGTRTSKPKATAKR